MAEDSADFQSNSSGSGRASMTSSPVNFKRVFALAVRYWYWVLIGVLFGLVPAFLYNRYATPIYTVNASIIIRESDENSSARFLLNNSLINPDRNFYNELYLMRSVSLLEEVVRDVNFMVSWFVEGNIKKMEFYDPEWPVQIKILPAPFLIYGQSFGFTLNEDQTVTLEHMEENDLIGDTPSISARIGDTIRVNNGAKIMVLTKGDVGEVVGKRFMIRFNNPTTVASSYASKLNITWAEQGASVVNIGLEGPVPAKEAAFITKFIEHYQQYDVNKKNVVATKSLEFLNQQISTMGDSLRYFEDQITNFRRSNLSEGLGSDAEMLYNQVRELDEQKNQMALMTKYYDYLEEYINSSQDYEQIIPPAAVGVTDLLLADLIKQLMTLQFSIRLQGDAKADVNPLVQEKKRKIQQLKKDIVEGLQSVRKTHKIQENFVQQRLNEAEKRLSGFPESERKLAGIERNYSVRENLFLFLLQKKAEAGISRASTTSDIILVNPPMRSGGAITPKPMQNYLTGLGFGLALPLLGFILIEFFNNKIQSREDIQELTTIPLIGGIGHNDSGSNLVVVNKPKSSLAESFRGLRSNLNYFTGGQDKKVVMVTSSLSGEGKTFTCINLATVLAFSDKKVLVIGADLRRPRIFADFNLKNEVGLSQYLSGMAELDQIIQKTHVKNLEIIAGGAVPPNPSELLLNERMKTVTSTLLKTYDYIIFDTPPIGIVADAFSLVGFVDHTLFLIRQGYTPTDTVKYLHEAFEMGKLKSISIVFNDVMQRGPGYGYGYGYSYYGYGYGNSKPGSGSGDSYYIE